MGLIYVHDSVTDDTSNTVYVTIACGIHVLVTKLSEQSHCTTEQTVLKQPMESPYRIELCRDLRIQMYNFFFFREKCSMYQFKLNFLILILQNLILYFIFQINSQMTLR